MKAIGIKIAKDRLFLALVCLLTGLSLVPLFWIIIDLFIKGASVVSLRLFTTMPLPPPEAGGILNAIVGSIIVVGIALILAVPIGIACGIYLADSKGRLTRTVSLMVNVLQGLPSIVFGLLAYLWVVKPMGHFSAFSGAVALAIMLLPIVVKSTEETVRLIPFHLKEAAFALGASYTATIFKIILPASMGGVMSGVMLGLARIMGETAPLLFTSFGNPFFTLIPLKPVDTLPHIIFNYAMSPYESWHKLAWGASFVLIVWVIIINIIVKWIGRKWKIRF